MRQTCRRHPSAASFLATCSGCAQELYDIEQANRARAEADLTARVRTALGFPSHGQPAREAGETPTRLCLWDQIELNTLYQRVGGTVTTRTAQRSTSDGDSTWTATEITVTVDLPGIGPVEIVTDWFEEAGGHDLPLMRAALEPAA